MGIGLALVIAIVALAAYYLVRKYLLRGPGQGPSPGFNDEDIARAIEASWRRTAQEHARLFAPYSPREETEALANTEIEVFFVERLDEEMVTALVQPRVRGSEVPATARSLLLGTRLDWVEEVEQARRSLDDEPLPPGAIRVFCQLEDGDWGFMRLEDEEAEAVADTVVPIGGAVLLHTDWDEPPFAATALGPPEVVDNATVRVPLRITSIIPRWAYDDIGYPVASLRTDPDDNGDVREWSIDPWNNYSPSSTLEDDFRGIVLAQGGSHEGFLHFKADDEHGKNSIPDRPFTQLHFLDGSEKIIYVDLTRSVPPAERVNFDVRPPQGSQLTAGLGEQLNRMGSQWADMGEPPPTAGIGDTVGLTHSPESPWLDLTVLAPSEPVGETMVRLRARITARASGEEQYSFLPLQLATSPDRNGRIHHLWETARIEEDDDAAPNSLEGVTLQRGDTREGYIYFRPEEDSAGMPPETFTTLWYGPRLLELPIRLTSGQ